MRGIAFALALAAVVDMAPASGDADGAATPTFGAEPPPGYRDWRLISVAHEEGTLNDFRAILGNDIAFNAARDGKLPFPDGAIIARLAWGYVPLEESAAAFGHPQSYVAGAPRNGVQFMAKDSRKYAATSSANGASAPAGCHTSASPVTASAAFGVMMRIVRVSPSTIQYAATPMRT